MTKLALADAAKELIVPVTLPAPPTAGLDRLKFGPEDCVAETNVVFAGIASEKLTFWAALVPRFVTLIVYDRSVPATTVSWLPLVTCKSTIGAGWTRTLSLQELFCSFDSITTLLGST